MNELPPNTGKADTLNGATVFYNSEEGVTTVLVPLDLVSPNTVVKLSGEPLDVSWEHYDHATNSIMKDEP